MLFAFAAFLLFFSPFGVQAQEVGATRVNGISRYEEQRRELNKLTLTIMGSQSSAVYTRFAEDIQNVLDDPDPKGMRVLPILGRGGGQNMIDVLFLEKIDMGIVEQDVLAELKKKDPVLYATVEARVRYIMKIANSEIHVLVRPEIRKLEDLRGKKVSFFKQLSSSAQAAERVFNTCNVPVQPVYMDSDLGAQKLRTGEIAGLVRVGAAPHDSLTGFTAADGHFLPLDETALPSGCYAKLLESYLPSLLKQENYPKVVGQSEPVPTLANASLLTVYNLPEGSQRYRNVAEFVDKLFSNIDKFRDGPRHPKWKEINIAAEVPGWTRFKPAQDWITANLKSSSLERASPEIRNAFNSFMDDYSRKRGGEGISPGEKQVLFDQFTQWWHSNRRTAR